jgi:osmotically-inducible protein OsmY
MSAQPSQSASGQAGAMSSSSSSDQLKGQIETSLKNEPTLANANITANVTDDQVELSGSVPSGKEKRTARRIAQSYAGNRKVVDHLTTGGKSSDMSNPSSAKPSTTPPPQN